MNLRQVVANWIAAGKPDPAQETIEEPEEELTEEKPKRKRPPPWSDVWYRNQGGLERGNAPAWWS